MFCAGRPKRREKATQKFINTNYHEERWSHNYLNRWLSNQTLMMEEEDSLHFISLTKTFHCGHSPCKQRKWSKDWLLQRRTYGHANLLKEIRNSEPESFCNFFFFLIPVMIILWFNLLLCWQGTINFDEFDQKLFFVFFLWWYFSFGTVTFDLNKEKEIICSKVGHEPASESKIVWLSSKFWRLVKNYNLKLIFFYVKTTYTRSKFWTCMGPFSLNDRWGIKDNRATTFLHSSLFSAFRSVSPNFKLPVPICCHPISFSVSLSFSFLLSCPVGSSFASPADLVMAHMCTISIYVFSQWWWDLHKAQ